MGWLLILQLVTGQIIALDGGFDEQGCRAALARLASGDRMSITTKDGVHVPVARGFECKPKPVTS